MHVSPSFSITSFLIELSEAGKSSEKIGVLVESLVFSLVGWDDDWSSGAFSFCSTCVAMGCGDEGWSGGFMCCLWSPL